jgi:hypothetical protein
LHNPTLPYNPSFFHSRYFDDDWIPFTLESAADFRAGLKAVSDKAVAFTNLEQLREVREPYGSWRPKYRIDQITHDFDRPSNNYTTDTRVIDSLLG